MYRGEGNTTYLGAQAIGPGFLHLVTAFELETLRMELLRGAAPFDLEAKLERLSDGGLGHRYIAKNCADFINLLLASQQRLFQGASRTDVDRLLRVLAYVRKDDDVIPDYRSDGFADDQQEVHAALIEFNPLLQAFKGWRLRHQVPVLWTN